MTENLAQAGRDLDAELLDAGVDLALAQEAMDLDAQVRAKERLEAAAGAIADEIMADVLAQLGEDPKA